MKRSIDFGHIIEATKKLIILNSVFLAIMTLSRVVFFLCFSNGAHIRNLYTYLVQAFVLGIRFDLVIVAYINILITVSLFIVWAFRNERLFKGWFTFVQYYYFVMYALVFIILAADIGFYSYFQNHINIMIFGLFEDDTRSLMSTFAENYNIPLVAAGCSLVFVIIYFVCRYFIRSIKTSPMRTVNYRPLAKVAFTVLLVAGNALSARGSLNMFPLNPMDAAISGDAFINKLSLNGIHTLYKAVQFRMREEKGYDLVSEMGYEHRIDDAFSDLLNIDKSKLNSNALEKNLTRITARNTSLEKEPPNVIFIMMEGFGSELIKYNTAEFNVLGELKRHFDTGYVWDHFISADNGTIGSIEAVLLNIPKRPQSKAISQSTYAYKSYPSGMALPYKNAGYDTIFLYGGSIGWRNLDEFVPRLGFDTASGKEAMDPAYLENQWGVYDEFLFDHIYKKLSSETGRPKFIFAMTTSNHPPYSLPPTYTPLPIKVSSELEKSIVGNKDLAKKRFIMYQYANQRLGELLTRIKESKYGENTIIAVTGDHNFWNVFDYSAERYPDRYGVPLYLYVPDSLKPAQSDTSVTGSHIDIMPTLYNLSLSSREYVAVGTNLFDKAAPHIGFNSDGFIFSEYGAIKYSPKNGADFFYAWQDYASKHLSSTSRNINLDKELTYYRAALAVTDYYVKHSASIKDSKTPYLSDATNTITKSN